MEVEFWNFSKRENSTKRPTENSTKVNFVYKNSTDLHNPIIEVATDVTSYNYAKINNIYFYVENVDTYTRNIWTVNLRIDLLATFKTEILNTKAQVIYSSSQYNINALDDRIVASGEYDRQASTASFVGTLANQHITPSGTFAVTAISNNTNWASGVATIYFMTYQQMQKFADELVDATTWEGIKQFFQNPMDAIIECYYLPIDISQYTQLSTEGDVIIADYKFPETKARRPLATSLIGNSHTAQIDIPWLYNDFRRLSPYTELSLFVPFCGSKVIAPEMVYNIDRLFIDYTVDVSTGNIQAIVYNKEEVLEEFTGNCKVSLPIGQSQTRVSSTVGFVGGVATAITGFTTSSVISGVSGINWALSSVATPTVNKTMGAFNGSPIGAIIGNETKRWQTFRLSITSRMTTDEPDNIRPIIGNVLNKVVTLSELSGYVQTNNVSVDIPTYKHEITEINNTLNGGAYIE